MHAQITFFFTSSESVVLLNFFLNVLVISKKKKTNPYLMRVLLQYSHNNFFSGTRIKSRLRNSIKIVEITDPSQLQMKAIENSLRIMTGNSTIHVYVHADIHSNTTGRPLR